MRYLKLRRNLIIRKFYTYNVSLSDTSPEQTPQQDDIDDEFDDDYFPPPPPDLAEIPPPNEAEPVSRIQPMPVQQQKKKGKYLLTF